MFKKTNGIREILICALTRPQLIDFIIRKDGTWSARDLAEYSDRQLKDIAHIADEMAGERRRSGGLTAR